VSGYLVDTLSQSSILETYDNVSLFMHAPKKALIRQFLFYLAVGGGNTLLTACVMATLGRVGLHYVLYTVIGYSVGFLNSYYWNSRLTFRTQTTNRTLLIKFMIVNVGLLLCVQILQIFLIEFIKIAEVPSVVMGMGIYTFAGFGINRCLLTCENKNAL